MLLVLCCAVSVSSFSQATYCDSLGDLFMNNNFEACHRIMLAGVPSKPDDCYLLEALCWVALGFFDQATVSIAELKQVQYRAEADSLLARIEELRYAEREGRFAAKLSSEKSSAHNELTAGVVGNELIVLRDSTWMRLNFPLPPIKVRRYWPVALSDSLNETVWYRALVNLDYDHIGWFSFYRDRWMILTAVERKPYAKKANSGNYGLKVIDLVTGTDSQKMELQGADCDYIHPHIYGDTLYFASNRPGGFGGYDLWACIIGIDTLGAMINLGSNVNSAGNEGRPFLNNDTLYFTSDRADRGYGKKDIYFHIGRNSPSRNAGPGINTPFNDFGMVWSSESSAYFTSDRPAGRGNDDVYQANWHHGRFFNEIIGRLETSTPIVSGSTVRLINLLDGAIATTLIDQNGYFRFRGVEGKKDYSLQFSGMELGPESTIQLYDKKGNHILQAELGDDQSFRIELLSPQDYFLPAQPNGDESILSIQFQGQTTSDSKAIKEIVIFLEDSKGDLLGATCTEENGKFSFDQVKPDSRYIIRTEVLDPRMAIHILDSEGEIIETILPDKTNGYVYVRIPDDREIITFTNERAERVAVSIDEIFRLPVINYDLDETSLNQSSCTNLLRVANLLKENPDIEIVLSGHTDSRGSAVYNERLSQKRIDSVVAWLAQNGIAQWRVSGRGYGESKILNGCLDGVNCTEEEHALNRRTELQFRKNKTITSSPNDSKTH